MYKLPLDPDWFLNTKDIGTLDRARLTSPFVHQYIDSLPPAWRDFAHVVHYDIYLNYVTYRLYVKRSMAVDGYVSMVKLWIFVLTGLGKSFNELPMELRNLILHHL
jgi:hypothetical protein